MQKFEVVHFTNVRMKRACDDKQVVGLGDTSMAGLSFPAGENVRLAICMLDCLDDSFGCIANNLSGL